MADFPLERQPAPAPGNASGCSPGCHMTGPAWGLPSTALRCATVRTERRLAKRRQMGGRAPVWGWLPARSGRKSAPALLAVPADAVVAARFSGQFMPDD